MEWQPIETAPKDGTRIFGYPVFDKIEIVYFNINLGWFCDINSQDGLGFDNCEITHWMPLPAAPV